MDFSSLLGLKRKPKNGFNDFERHILTETLARCAVNYRDLLQQQIDTQPIVYRLDEGLEVRIAEAHYQACDPHKKMRLPLDANEHVFAEVKVHGHVLSSNHIVIRIFDGYLYGLDYQSPTEHAQVANINAVRVQLSPIFAPDNLRAKSTPVTINGQTFYLPNQ